MKGAREYSELFHTGQIGRLYIVSGHHARGNTFHIYVLPEGEAAIRNGPNNACINSSAVEVYGVICGQPGWTEEYGWLHRGPWVDDFYKIAKERSDARYAAQVAQVDRVKVQRQAEDDRRRSLLSTYKASEA